MAPLYPLLPPRTAFCEPCAGDGAMVNYLEGVGHRCVLACDIHPMGLDIERRDAAFLSRDDVADADFIITNPPWERPVLHQLIDRFMTLGVRSWLLFDADWAFTAQSAPFIRFCEQIVPIGRVKWIPGSKSNGMDHAAWYLFNGHHDGPTLFAGRT